MVPFASPVGDVKKVSSTTLCKEQSNKGHLIIIILIYCGSLWNKRLLLHIAVSYHQEILNVPFFTKYFL